jgi:hypothetical protein
VKSRRLGGKVRQVTLLNLAQVCHPSKNTSNDQQDATFNYREWHYIRVFGESEDDWTVPS